ncbi:MAG: hypothetical protein ABIG94_10020 [Pseudomonadota bacterium]
MSNVERDWYQWKWAILALHSSLQGFMVMALRGSDGLNCLRDDVAAEWFRAYRAGEKLPIEKLDNFLNLYKKIKKANKMTFYIHSKPFKPSGTEGTSIKKINSLRNDFVHFVPKSWSLEVTGLPPIFLDCLNIIDFLGWRCNNIIWYESAVEKRASKALSEAMKRIKDLKDS